MTWKNDGDGYQTHTCECGHQWIAKFNTTGRLERPKCYCKRPIPDLPPSTEGIDYTIAICPKCGDEVQDFDGFGVLCHNACGYCRHPSIIDGQCCACGREP